MRHEEPRPDRPGGVVAPRGVEPPTTSGAGHSRTCLCGCAVAVYSMADTAASVVSGPRGRAA